jgi:hypothetical protein
LPATHASVGDCWQTRDTLVSHANATDRRPAQRVRRIAL